MPGPQKPGDILVATALLPYDYKIVKCCPSGSPIVDYSEVPTFPAQPVLVELFERAGREWSIPVHLGAFLSGAARIHCSTYRDELWRAFSDRGMRVVGGEMEGIGLSASSNQTESRWILVKGISDFADENRDAIIKSTRPEACYNAVKFVLSALKDEENIRAKP